MLHGIKKTNWVISSNQEKPLSKASLMLLSKWVIKNIPKMMTIINESNKLLSEYSDAPDIIILNDGNIFEIETRGNLTDIYFLLSDVEKVFEIPELNKNISNYIKNEHYKFFYINNEKLYS